MPNVAVFTSGEAWVEPVMSAATPNLILSVQPHDVSDRSQEEAIREPDFFLSF